MDDIHNSKLKQAAEDAWEKAWEVNSINHEGFIAGFLAGNQYAKDQVWEEQRIQRERNNEIRRLHAANKR